MEQRGLLERVEGGKKMEEENETTKKMVNRRLWSFPSKQYELN